MVYEDARAAWAGRFGPKAKTPIAVAKIMAERSARYSSYFEDGGLLKDDEPFRSEAVQSLEQSNVYVEDGGQRFLAGMPALLRSNVEPSLGLYNGKQAHILGFLDHTLHCTARELQEQSEYKSTTPGVAAVQFEDEANIAQKLGTLATKLPWSASNVGSPVVRLFPEGQVVIIPPSDLVACTIKMKRKGQGTKTVKGRVYASKDEVALVVRVHMIRMATCWTVHNAQGATFRGRVIYNPYCSDRMRQPGLAYVAMSRARELRHL